MSTRHRTEDEERSLRHDPFDRAVATERAYQARRWGDVHDDDHTPPEWGLILLRHAGRVGERLEGCLYGAFDDEPAEALGEVRAEAVKLAAICAALVDRLDRCNAERLGEEADDAE